MDSILPKHREVFDNVVLIERDDALEDDWKLANEWQAWHLTPYKETIKLDSDILFNRNVDHWWNICQLKDVNVCTTVRTFEGDIVRNDYYRKLHTGNNLPSVYSGFTYFRYTQLSKDFYNYVRLVFRHWAWFRDSLLKDCRHEKPNTDEVYAIACLLLGEEECYTNGDVPSFVHKKGQLNMVGNGDWMDKMYSQVDDEANLTVGFNRQAHPFHYVNKEFCSGELIERFEGILARRKAK